MANPLIPEVIDRRMCSALDGASSMRLACLIHSTWLQRGGRLSGSNPDDG